MEDLPMQRDLRTRRTFKETFIGDKAFYSMVIAIVLPIIVQNAITNFVSLLDNIMVGRIGTEQMSGVSIANQLLFVFNLCVFGGVSGAGIFAAQFYGAGNDEGVRHCFRYKVMLSILLVVAALVIFFSLDETLIRLYLNEADAAEQVERTLQYGLDYLHVMMLGLIPFALTQTYAGTLRETGETNLPMVAGIIAVFVNLVFNYLLIYGKFGFPELGVRGAAIATVLSRYVELAIVICATHMNRHKYRFIQGAYRTMHIPGKLVKEITIKGMPLMVNECLWSLGMATLTQCYSMRGLNVVAAMNISSTVSNLFSVVFLSMGSAISIILGQSLGAGETDLARSQAWKLTATSVFGCLGTALLLAVCSPFIPHIYETSDAVRTLACRLLLVFSACMTLSSLSNSAYFILRSGGKTLITFMFDSGFTWVACIPLAWCLVHLTDMNIVWIYFCIQMLELVKATLGFTLVKKGVWINNMVG